MPIANSYLVLTPALAPCRIVELRVGAAVLGLRVARAGAARVRHHRDLGAFGAPSASAEGRLDCHHGDGHVRGADGGANECRGVAGARAAVDKGVT